MSDLFKYSFTAKGVTPEGNKLKCSGYIYGPYAYPFELFEKVEELVKKQFPGITCSAGKSDITLRKLKPKKIKKAK